MIFVSTMLIYQTLSMGSANCSRSALSATSLCASRAGLYQRRSPGLSFCVFRSQARVGDTRQLGVTSALSVCKPASSKSFNPINQRFRQFYEGQCNSPVQGSLLVAVYSKYVACNVFYSGEVQIPYPAKSQKKEPHLSLVQFSFSIVAYRSSSSYTSIKSTL